jgi:hypothetical protein
VCILTCAGQREVNVGRAVHSTKQGEMEALYRAKGTGMIKYLSIYRERERERERKRITRCQPPRADLMQ